MTTAPQENRGGDRPTAPQNNPANVNPLGGNGQSGQAATYISGLPYGQGGATYQSQLDQPMFKAPDATAGAPDMASIAGSMSGVVPLDAPSQDNRPVTDGAPIGPGSGMEALPTRLQNDRRISENADLIKRYLPDLINATRLKNAPDSYKQFVNDLKGSVE
jgi:hypothetical protein